jgi:hypothetical protein
MLFLKLPGVKTGLGGRSGLVCRFSGLSFLSLSFIVGTVGVFLKLENLVQDLITKPDVYLFPHLSSSRMLRLMLRAVILWPALNLCTGPES